MNTILSIAIACTVVAILAVATFGKQTLVVLLFVLAIIFGGITQGATQFAPGEGAVATRLLSGKIASVERDKYNATWMQPLLVVSNQSDRTYEVTHWDCIFYLNGAPVTSDTFSVRQVRPGETASRRMTRDYQFDRSDCRLTLAY